MHSVLKALLLIEQESKDCVEDCNHPRKGGKDEAKEAALRDGFYPGCIFGTDR
jgi:hypothetical protein